MRTFKLLIPTLLTTLLVACGGSNGSAVVPVAELGSEHNGNYEGLGTFLIDIKATFVNPAIPPLQSDCVGDSMFSIDTNATETIASSGACMLLSYPVTVTYALAGEFVDKTNFKGLIMIRLEGVDHILSFSGTVANDILTGSFAGGAPQTADLSIEWDGAFTARLVP